MTLPPRRRDKPKPFVPGDVVDVAVAKGLDPSGGRARATIDLDASAQHGWGMFRVVYEDDGRRDIVSQVRFSRAED